MDFIGTALMSYGPQSAPVPSAIFRSNVIEKGGQVTERISAFSAPVLDMMAKATEAKLKADPNNPNADTARYNIAQYRTAAETLKEPGRDFGAPIASPSEFKMPEKPAESAPRVSVAPPQPAIAP